MSSVPSVLGPASVLVGDALPAALAELARPPERLHVAGAWPSFERAITVVGTRRASPDAAHVARRMGEALAAAGCVVVSGAAHGIDGEAHRGALAAGGKTVAVLAAPLDAPYPASHVPLLREIVSAGGAVATEAPPGSRPFKKSFLDRNRIVAALGRAVVVVEAPVRSGTLSTVAHARVLGRPIFAVPWSPLDTARAGGVALLGRGEARACRDAGDVLDALGWPHAAPRPPSPLDEDGARVLGAVADGHTHVDGVVAATGLPASRARAALFALSLDGRIVEDRGRYRPA